ncbi:unnamed protein product, partial [Mesorhabditis spiculigera]
MAASFEFQGRKYVLDDTAKQYKTAFDDCRGALEETAAIFREPGFDTDMNGWKPDHSSQTTKMFYSDRKNGRYFCGKTQLPLTTEKALAAVFADVESSVKWNDSYKFSKKHMQLGEDLDISHYATNKKLIVEGREFICARAVFRDADGSILFAAKSTELKEIKEGEHGVRAHLYISAGRVRPLPNDATKCTYDYVVCVDMKGMMWKSVLNPVLGRLLHEDVENVRRHCEKLAAEGK